MATIFQKIFLSPEEVGLIDIINSCKIQAMNEYDNFHMTTKAQYLIDNEKAKILATHDWHYAQGDNYTLNVNLPHHKLTASNEHFAKKIFMRMEKAYRKQREH